MLLKRFPQIHAGGGAGRPANPRIEFDTQEWGGFGWSARSDVYFGDSRSDLGFRLWRNALTRLEYISTIQPISVVLVYKGFVSTPADDGYGPDEINTNLLSPIYRWEVPRIPSNLRPGYRSSHNPFIAFEFTVVRDPTVGGGSLHAQLYTPRGGPSLPAYWYKYGDFLDATNRLGNLVINGVGTYTPLNPPGYGTLTFDTNLRDDAARNAESNPDDMIEFRTTRATSGITKADVRLAYSIFVPCRDYD